MMTEDRDIEATLNAYFDGMNSERYEDVAALFTEDAELKAPGIEWVKGRSAIEGYYRAALAPYPRHRDEATRILISGATATAEIHFSGAMASGAEMDFDAVDVFDFDDSGLVRRMTSWYDSHAVRSRLRRARAAAEASAETA